MRTSLRVVLATIMILALSAGPVLAGKPIRGCGAGGFDLMSYEEFRDLSIAVGVPEELLGDEHRAGWDVYDRNGDGSLCVKDLPDTAGHLGSWVFNVVDNTANR